MATGENSDAAVEIGRWVTSQARRTPAAGRRARPGASRGRRRPKSPARPDRGATTGGVHGGSRLRPADVTEGARIIAHCAAEAAVASSRRCEVRRRDRRCSRGRSARADAPADDRRRPADSAARRRRAANASSVSASITSVDGQQAGRMPAALVVRCRARQPTRRRRCVFSSWRASPSARGLRFCSLRARRSARKRRYASAARRGPVRHRSRRRTSRARSPSP